MGWRFRRSVRIIPGVRLNISKSGVSTSIGRRGATVNISKHGVRQTYGLPGTGLSYTRYKPHGPRPAKERSEAVAEPRFPIGRFLAAAFMLCGLIALASRLF